MGGIAAWKHWSKTDKLLPSGLIGPVQIVVVPDSSIPAAGK